MTKRYIQEAARLAPKKNPDGTYRLVAIDEGEGSTGIYSSELLAASESVFEGAPSFINHPIDPNRPQDRDLNTLAGRLSNMRVEVVEGKTALVGDYRPRKEYQSLIEEFGDIIGASIFCGAYGEKNDDGKVVVEAFDGEDRYRSVDLVVAAGRGGRFDRATESLRAIESSLGLPEGNKPAVEASAEEKEGIMEKEILEAINAIAESLKPVVAFVNESAAAKATEAQAQVDAEAVDAAVEEALKGYEEKVVAIEAADLLEPQVADLKARARKGEDITSAIESAKTIVEAAAQKVAESTSGGYIHESSAKSDGFAFSFGGRR